MDCEDNSLMDSHENLFKLLANSKLSPEETVCKYFESVKFPPIEDFPKGLEWFNVSESLSFKKHLKGKIVVLDFFTYCCINCMHILPDLKDIEEEFSVEDGLVVVGVHSAKFENEKQSNNVLSAVQRYNINHPVCNDNNSAMWQKCDVHCWPTLLLIGPFANPLVMMMGEGNKNSMKLCIRAALKHYAPHINHESIPIKLEHHLLENIDSTFLFPGKLTIRGGLLAISDSGKHRIVLVKNNKIFKIIGGVGGSPGFIDGYFESAKFNNPQGLVFLDDNTIFVADTDNHAIRKIDLKEGKVETIAGNGSQGNDKFGGKIGKAQVISSPWDVALYNSNGKNVLIIAMAGTHQIWAIFLEETEWWKGKKYLAGTVVCIVGSGREENRNNQYPMNAAFAQPSGLAISKKRDELYLADSESSAIRKVSLKDGKVSAIVGGDRNPNNLFAFGDKDGTSLEAKLQHPLGVALSTDEESLYVTDTYNHKIKSIALATNTIKTVNCQSKFNEPSGVAVDSNGLVYIADTNNHCIKILLDNKVEKLDLSGETTEVDKMPNKFLMSETLQICNNGKIEIVMIFTGGLIFTPGANQNWSVTSSEDSIVCTPTSGNFVGNSLELDISSQLENDGYIDLNFNFVTCTPKTCFPKKFIVRQPLTHVHGAAGQKQIVIQLSPRDIKLKKITV